MLLSKALTSSLASPFSRAIDRSMAHFSSEKASSVARLFLTASIKPSEICILILIRQSKSDLLILLPLDRVMRSTKRDSLMRFVLISSGSKFFALLSDVSISTQSFKLLSKTETISSSSLLVEAFARAIA